VRPGKVGVEIGGQNLMNFSIYKASSERPGKLSVRFKVQEKGPGSLDV
jgi:hypothetical protein